MLLWIAGIFIALDLLVVGLFFVPPIQNFVIQKVTEGISKKWGAEIGVKRIYVTPTLKIAADDFVIKDLRGNPMIFVGNVKGRFKALETQPLTLKFFNITASKADVSLVIYKGDSVVNISHWAKAISNPDSKSSGFILRSNDIQLVDSRFSIANQNVQQQTPYVEGQEFDPGFFEIRHIDFEASKFQVYNDDISALIKQIAFDQYFGFKLLKGEGDFQINNHLLRFKDCRLLTEHSNLDLDLRFDYSDWDRLGDFLDSVYITADIRPSEFGMEDAAAYAGAIRGMDEQIQLEGGVNGCVNNMTLCDFTCHLGEKSFFAGNFTLKNITDINNVEWNLIFDESNFCLHDIERFTLPQGKTITLPKIVKRLGDIQLYGSTSGYLPAISTDLDIHTGVGKLYAGLSSSENYNNIDIGGSISSSNFNLGKLIQNNDFGIVSFDMDVDAESDLRDDNPDYLATTKGSIQSHIKRFDILSCPLSNIDLNVEYKNKKITADLNSFDKRLNLNLDAITDFSLIRPNFQVKMSLKNMNVSEIASFHPLIDSAKAKGFERFIVYAQSQPDVDFSIDSLSVNIYGSELEDLNGFVAIDGLSIQNSGENFVSDRLRLTAINTESGLHKYILSSNFVNATLNTNYKYEDIKDSLVNIAYKYIPTLLPEKKSVQKKSIRKEESSSNKYFSFYVETYNLDPLLYIFLPDIDIEEHSIVDLYFDETSTKDRVKITIPEISYQNKYFINDLKVAALSLDNKKLNINALLDSFSIKDNQGASLAFYNFRLRADLIESFFNFQLVWKDAADAQRELSHLSGTFDATNPHNLIGKITDSKIFIDQYEFRFNNLNSIAIQDDRLAFENLTVGDAQSYITIDGAYSKREEDQLHVTVNDVNIGLVNNFLDGLSFDGNLSANADIRNYNGSSYITGKLLTTGLVFNDAHFGNLFLTAGFGENGSMGFSGGLFHRDENISSSLINDYSIRNYQQEKVKLANITGHHDAREKRFVINANVGHLDLRFLNKFLSSFSEKITGDASGELSFIATTDSTYIDGKAHINHMDMGISPLGTLYHIKDQDISFNRKGIVFNNIQLTDDDMNAGTLSGHIYHNLFKDMKIDLDINTQRLMALNLPKASGSSFYGKGYVAGNVKIAGNDKGLRFSSNDLKTLKGSSIIFPITSSQSVSENESIRFKTIVQDSVVVVPTKEKTMPLTFDFDFDVTKETDVQVDVFAIGGTMRGNTNGKLHLVYDEPSGLNIFGKLDVSSGIFLLSLEDIINTKFKLVEGGTVVFNGPVADFVVNISAFYSSKASMNNILGISDVGNNSRMPVNAYIHLNGQLMKYPKIRFSFELPNAGQEVNKQFFMAIDTTNPQNCSKQFFMFVLTNQFLPDNATTNDISNSVESGSISLLTNMVNNFLSRQMKHGGVGIVYKSGNQNTAAEYGLNANVQFLNDRMIFETNIGYYDNAKTATGRQGIQDFYGDFSLEYLITERGNWRIKVYNFNDQYALESFKKIPGVGLALLYKQDFNSKKDFTDEFKTSKIVLDKKNKKSSQKKGKSETTNKQ